MGVCGIITRKLKEVGGNGRDRPKVVSEAIVSVMLGLFVISEAQ